MVERIPYTVPEEAYYSTVLVDIDGTLALRNGRGPFDWAKVGSDIPNRNVVTLVEDLASVGHHIIFLSGREDTGDCRKDTIDWLKTHLDFLDKDDMPELYMRPYRDGRPDDEVKYELFDTHIRDFNDVSFVLDDRDRVVKMWREIGLTCLQVAEGNF